MIVREYRIVLPLDVEEYRIAQLYQVAETSIKESEKKEGEGVEVIKNEPYENGPGGKGQYTYKVYHLGSQLPGWLRSILPETALHIHEEAWNAYPYCLTEVKNHWMGDSFLLRLETMHLPDRGATENACNLQPDQLKLRTVVPVDIAYDPLPASYYKEAEDPKLFRSGKTGRGQLKKGWEQTHEPVMCAYKVITTKFVWRGLQTTVEKFMHGMLADLNRMFHRQVFASIDKWHGLTMADIRRIEAQTQLQLASAAGGMASIEDNPSSDDGMSQVDVDERAVVEQVVRTRRESFADRKSMPPPDA